MTQRDALDLFFVACFLGLMLLLVVLYRRLQAAEALAEQALEQLHQDMAAVPAAHKRHSLDVHQRKLALEQRVERALGKKPKGLVRLLK
jgi:hypothetical protein